MPNDSIINPDADQSSSRAYSFFSPGQNFDQLLPSSCTAFSCAQAFAKVLQRTTQDSPMPYKQTVRLFEIVIYPEIWESKNGVANEERAMEYLMSHLTHAPEFFKRSEFQSMDTTNDDLFFGIYHTIGRNEQIISKHTEFIEKDGNVFLYNEKRYNALSEILIAEAIKIKKTDWNVLAVQARYLEYKNKIDDVLNHFDPDNPLHHYYVNSLTLCPNEFPEYRSLLLNIITSHLEKLIENGQQISLFFKNFPEIEGFLENEIRKKPEKFFATIYEVSWMMEIFPRFKPMLLDMLIEHSDKFMRGYRFETALEACPHLIEVADKLVIKMQNDFFWSLSDIGNVLSKYNLKEALSGIFVAQQTKFVKNVRNMVEAVKLFPEHKALLREDIKANQVKYLLNIESLKSAALLFPEDKQVFSDFFNNNMNKIMLNEDLSMDLYGITKHFFPEHLPKVRRLVLENLEKYLKDLSQIKMAICNYPELKDPIAKIVLKSPETFVHFFDIPKLKAILSPVQLETQPSRQQGMVFGCMI